MKTPEKDKRKQKPEDFPEKEQEWDNPRNPEATEDERDSEQLARQLEEAKRRKENLTDEE